jgi:hypothetical protein
MPFDVEREVGTPTGRSSATNTCGRNGGTRCDRGSAKSRTSARPDLVTVLGIRRSQPRLLSRGKTGNRARLREAVRPREAVVLRSSTVPASPSL